MKLNAEIENLERQLKNYKQTILELENKISLLIKENERISVAYDQKMKEIDILNYRAQNQERVRAQELEQLRNEMEKRSMDNFV
jgi:ribosomal 50S subunit-recycling heat shock protein